jgi:hypothetical protein
MGDILDLKKQLFKLTFRCKLYTPFEVLNPYKIKHELLSIRIINESNAKNSLNLRFGLDFISN